MDDILDLPIIDGPVPWIVYAVSIALVVCLLIRPVTVRWVLRAVIGVLAGAAVALGAFLITNALNSFGDAQPHAVLAWAMAGFGAIGLAIVSLWDSRVWRKIVAVFAIIWFTIATVVGINAFYGLNPTAGSLFGIVTSKPVALPTGSGAPTATGPLYLTFTPPQDMPQKGTQGTVDIPATESGFVARPAGLYLPPAALVPDAPALPLVIMMMGYPGSPDPSYIGGVLDEFAAKNDGLAPIVVVADQIGTGADPACADSSAVGNAETYIKKDVVDWARKNLHIIDDPASWVIAGYSNGGGCAIKYGAQQPDMWKNILDISGEIYPGSEDVDGVIATIYQGDSAAFEASKPITIMSGAPRGTYAGVTAVFTVGGSDPTFIPQAQSVSDAARAAGMATTYTVIPGAGHVVDGLTGGLEAGFGVLYPVLGLSAH